ncbi:hypothetical protein HN748_04850 [Candidatus Peregrinibacteria bacterium]|nr:hypothetical protein [Candidatus Peregrinibacteria bacterium]
MSNSVLNKGAEDIACEGAPDGLIGEAEADFTVLSEEVEKQSWLDIRQNIVRVRSLINRFGIKGLLLYNAGKATIGGVGGFMIYDGPPEEKALAALTGVAAAIIPSYSFWTAMGMIAANGVNKVRRKSWEDIAAELESLEPASDEGE